MVFEKIAAMLADRIGCDVKELSMETKFETLGIDSLDVMELLMLMEEEFGTDIEIGDAKLATMADLVGLVESRLGEQA
ncbi:MAG: acyl carrier protein [Clostridiales bacterium]|nr:acyl carrier protein [Clostridiales bacterium]